jgi:hypothetical protein
VALLANVGLGDLLLREQLFHAGLQRRNSPIGLENAWPAGERHRRVDVWHIGESLVCDCHAPH